MSKKTQYSSEYQTMLLSGFEESGMSTRAFASSEEIKPFVIERKNFLFCKTENGADATAELFSIIQMTKPNLLIPDQY